MKNKLTNDDFKKLQKIFLRTKNKRIRKKIASKINKNSYNEFRLWIENKNKY